MLFQAVVIFLLILNFFQISFKRGKVHFHDGQVILNLQTNSVTCTYFFFKPDSYAAGFTALPIIYFIVISVNLFAVFYNGSESKSGIQNLY